MLKELFEGVAVDFIKEHINKLIVLLPSGITVYIQKNYWMVLFIFVSSLALYFFVKIKSLGVSGITQVYKPKHLSTAKALEKTETFFYFLGVSAKSTANDKEIENQFIRMAQRSGYEIRFLLMSPSAIENIRARAKDENDDHDAWILDMKSSIFRLKKTAERHGLNIQIRLYDEYPLWRMVIIDKKNVFLNYALYSRKINDSPLIKMSNNNDALCNTFIQSFELLWNKSSTLTLEKWLENNTL